MKIYKPIKNTSNRKYNHNGDTFREILDIWKDLKLIEIELGVFFIHHLLL